MQDGSRQDGSLTKPKPRRSKAQEIREGLEQAIVTHDFAPGERLEEQELAQRFGASRTPVREALNQLASAGLVELVPNRGAFVREVSVRELVQMFEVMAELEGMAGRLAARRAMVVEIARIETALGSCEAAGRTRDPDAYFVENERFHKAIYDACGNDFLAAEARRLHDRLRPFRRFQLRVPRRLPQSLAEHRRILAAIAEGRDGDAETELRGHILIQGERFQDFVATIPA